MPRSPLRARARRTILAALVSVAVVVLPAIAIAAAAPAMAGGSNDPTPYAVTADGVTLPEGVVFQDNGHVNVRYVLDGRQQPANAHFEAKCITRSDAECRGERHALAQFIGQRTLPWDAMGVPMGACIVWVQMSAYNEHFGEGGQAPVCRTTPTPTEPTPSEPTPSAPAPSEPTPSAPAPSEPTPSVPTPSEPTPSVPTPSEPTPSTPAVVSPQIQDYVGACDAAFVLDNGSSTIAVTYTIQGVDYLVPAGGGLHTDADGTRILPIDGQYVITTDTGRTWTFAARACPMTPTPSDPAPSDPAPSAPAPSDPTPSDPTPSDPTPSDPAPSDPTPSDPAPSDPTPSDPTPSDPTPSEPGTDVPAVDPPIDPSPSEEPPATEEPTDGEQPTTEQPTTEVPTEVGTPAASAEPVAAAPTPVASQPTPSQTAVQQESTLPRTGAQPLLLVMLVGGLLVAMGAAVRIARR